MGVHSITKEAPKNRDGARACSNTLSNEPGVIATDGHAERVEKVESPDARKTAASRGSGTMWGFRRETIIVAALVAFTAAWAIAGLATGGDWFVILVSDKLRGNEEAASALARLFAALVLGLFLKEEMGQRMIWVATGLLVLGMGHLVSGYIEPIFQPAHLTEGLYEVLTVYTLAGILFVIGLVPRNPPRLSGRSAAVIFVVLTLAYSLVYEPLDEPGFLPVLAEVNSSQKAVELGPSPVWLTPWYWVLGVLPLGLMAASAVGAFRQNRRGLLPGWLLVATVLMAAAVAHEYLWPSGYGGGVLTTADLLRLVVAVVVAVGGILELRRIAGERTKMLATERERLRRLDELTSLRASFGAMVAHELCGPIAAIHRLNEMLDRGGSDPEIRTYVKDSIELETRTLDDLVADVRAAAMVERDDFKVEPRPLALAALLEDARTYVRSLSEERPVKISYLTTPDGRLKTDERVWADPKRIGQVLRNLLSNAAKYTPEGTPIEIRASACDSARVRIEVADQGPGIHPDDLVRIFEKFGRGRDQEGRKVAGVGLGLYLSKRIVWSHGSDLTVRSELGSGSVFAFELEVVR